MHRDCIVFAVYSNSRATTDIMLPSLGLEEPSSGALRVYRLGYLISSDP